MASFERVEWRNVWSLDRALARTRETAEAAKLELADADKSAGRPMTPPELVGYARDRPDLVIHGAFTWDDSEAAERFRVTQARELRRSLVVTVQMVERDVAAERRLPVYASVKLVEQRRCYVPTATLVETEDGRAALVTEAIEYLKQGRRRYAMLTELAEVFDHIDRLDPKAVKSRRLGGPDEAGQARQG